MPVYINSEQLYESLKALFERLKNQDPAATRSVTESKLVIRLNIDQPKAEVSINGRLNPVRIVYGSSSLRPDLDVDLSADALHHILLKELSLRKALASGQIKVRGPIWKAPALEDIFHQGQILYPTILQGLGLDGFHNQ